MFYGLLNYCARRPIIAVTTCVVASMLIFGTAVGVYMTARDYLDLDERRGFPSVTSPDNRDGCPRGQARVLKLPDGSRGCVDPVRNARQEGYQKGIDDTFGAIIEGRTACPVSMKSEQN